MALARTDLSDKDKQQSWGATCQVVVTGKSPFVTYLQFSRWSAFKTVALTFIYTWLRKCFIRGPERGSDVSYTLWQEVAGCQRVSDLIKPVHSEKESCVCIRNICLPPSWRHVMDQSKHFSLDLFVFLHGLSYSSRMFSIGWRNTSSYCDKRKIQDLNEWDSERPRGRQGSSCSMLWLWAREEIWLVNRAFLYLEGWKETPRI